MSDNEVGKGSHSCSHSHDEPKRVETGTLQFGDDWPGLFIRGDDAMHGWSQINALLANPEDEIAKRCVESLGLMLKGTNTEELDKEHHQHVRPWDNVTNSRVVMIAHGSRNKGGEVFIFGYGLFEGHFVPPKDATPLFDDILKQDPEYRAGRIRLDNGDIVWEPEGHIVQEKEFRKDVDDNELIVSTTSISEYRDKVKAKEVKRKAPKLGDRMVAIQHVDSEKDEAHVFGFGVYDGEHVPPPEINPGIRRDLISKNPRILLDSGEVVWGCECWWQLEEDFRKKAEKEGLAIVLVEISDFRRRVDESAADQATTAASDAESAGPAPAEVGEVPEAVTAAAAAHDTAEDETAGGECLPRGKERIVTLVEAHPETGTQIVVTKDAPEKSPD